MARRKNDFKIGEELKKELLSKMFKENGYGKTSDDLLREMFCGYIGLTVVEVRFFLDMVSIDRVCRTRGREDEVKMAMSDIVSNVFGRQVNIEECEPLHDYNQDLQARVIYAGKGITLFFYRKAKEDAA